MLDATMEWVCGGGHYILWDSAFEVKSRRKGVKGAKKAVLQEKSHNFLSLQMP